MLLKRSYDKEIMDDFSIQDERIDKALEELKIINKFLGGNSASRVGIKKIISKNSLKNNIKILDAGGGASDILLSFKEKNYIIFCADLNKRVTNFVKKKSPKVRVVCADVLHLPFKEKQFDIIHASLFLHHFNEEDIKQILIYFSSSAKYGIVINDLQRSIFALSGIKILTSLFSKSDMVKKDGPLSVKRAFRRSELIKILSEMDFTNYEIKYRWAFRWLIIIYF